jgi:hypothetical protein
MIFDSDDFGCSHIISDQCQSHDCRDVLDKLHVANPKFKATLFAIPGEMTWELVGWANENEDWIELAVHGFYHSTNYECETMGYNKFDSFMQDVQDDWGDSFVKGFKAPGWQISDDIYKWLLDNDWWVADQEYNNDRRPKGLKTYLLNDKSVHTHTWDCVGNGVYELYDELEKKVKATDEFYFISEVV